MNKVIVKLVEKGYTIRRIRFELEAQGFKNILPEQELVICVSTLINL